MARPLTIAAGALAALALLVRPPAGAATADPCAAISPQSLKGYAATIGAAYDAAATDAAKNGTSGEYATAARNARDQLKQAMDRATKAVADLGSDPSVTTPAEAGTVKEHVRYILQLVPQAAHWAIISEIYHKSPDARKAFEGSIKVLDQGNSLYAEAGRCYMKL